MDIEYLREFLALAAKSNYTEASGALGVSQPTLSRHIAALERELGMRLFERDTHKVVLTDEGREAIGPCNTILAEYDRLASKGRLTLRVGAPIENVDLRSGLLEAFLALRDDYPGAQLSFVKMTFDSCDDLLLQGKLDVGVTVHTDLPLTDITSVPLVKLPVSVYLSKESPLASRHEISLTDLAGCTWCTMSPTGDIGWSYASVQSLFARYGVTNVPWRFSEDPHFIGPKEFILVALNIRPEAIGEHLVHLEISERPTVPIDVYWRTPDKRPLIRRYIAGLQTLFGSV